jgi:hypothetical protein
MNADEREINAKAQLVFAFPMTAITGDDGDLSCKLATRLE